MLIVATLVILLVHVPYRDASSNVILAPVQTVVPDVMAVGASISVIENVAAVPQPVVYVIVAVPCATPVTMPVLADTLACPELLLLQVPDDAESVNVIADPLHTVETPDTTEGAAITEYVAVVFAPHPMV